RYGGDRVVRVGVRVVVEKIDARKRPETVVHIERVDEIVDLRRVLSRHKRRFARKILRLRIGSEIMIERNVLLEDHHQMFDRRRGLDATEIVAVAVVIFGDGGAGGHEGEGGYQTEGSGQTHEDMPPVGYWKNAMGCGAVT